MKYIIAILFVSTVFIVPAIKYCDEPWVRENEILKETLMKTYRKQGYVFEDYEELLEQIEANYDSRFRRLEEIGDTPVAH